MPAASFSPKVPVTPRAGPSFREMALGTRGQRSPEGPLGLGARPLLLLPGETGAPQPQPGGTSAMSGGAAGARPRRWRRVPPSASCAPHPASCAPHPPCAPCPPHPALSARPRRCSPRYPRLCRLSSAPGAHLKPAPSSRPAFPIDRGCRLSPPAALGGARPGRAVTAPGGVCAQGILLGGRSWAGSLAPRASRPLSGQRGRRDEAVRGGGGGGRAGGGRRRGPLEGVRGGGGAAGAPRRAGESRAEPGRAAPRPEEPSPGAV